MVDLCPEGSKIDVDTESEGLLREWAQMCEYADNGFGDLTASSFPFEWQEIMKQLVQKNKKMVMYQGSGPREEHQEAASLYSQEKIEYFEQVFGQPLDYEGPAEAPWI
jgi:hypothetical protein